MGNGQIKSTHLTDNKKKSFSFDQVQFSNYRITKISPINVSNSKHNHISSSMDMRTSSQHIMPPVIIDKNPSLSLIENPIIKSLSIKQQNAKLQKLNKINDQLRKQLIEINEKLLRQVQKKKSFTNNNTNGNGKNGQIDAQKKSLLSKQSSHNNNESKQKKKATNIIALKKQLQNAYSQVSSYKKHLLSLKKGESSQQNMKLQQYQDKLTMLDQQINNVQKSITSTRDIVDKQSFAIGEIGRELGGDGVEENKRQIVMLKQRLKGIKQKGRKREKDEKMRHQLMIQMERKLREVNGQYLPQIKNWSLQMPQVMKQSRVVSGNKVDTINNSNEQRQPPPIGEYKKMLNEHSVAKRAYQQSSRRIDFELRKKNEFIHQRKRIEQQLTTTQRTIQGLRYKKQRCLQTILQSVKTMENLAVGDRQ